MQSLAYYIPWRLDVLCFIKTKLIRMPDVSIGWNIWCYDLKFVEDANVALLFILVDFFLLVLLSIARGRCIVLTRQARA